MSATFNFDENEIEDITWTGVSYGFCCQERAHFLGKIMIDCFSKKCVIELYLPRTNLFETSAG